MQRAGERLERELVENGRGSDLDTLRPYLFGAAKPPPYRELVDRLGVSEASLKMKVHRLRRRFAASIRAEIRDTVASDEDVDNEIRHLLSVLRE
ncbi:MAG: hypothetical protein PVF43_00295 [Candidatus Eiseniibacteriota bacterium]|jgi:RNA polymerase sigma-70 factor (ECF subfamily)